MHRVLHECVVGCPILSSMYEHVPIYHLIVLDSIPSNTLCALTSHHRVRCSSGLKHLAKRHSHETYMRRAKQLKSRRGRYCFICLSVCLSVLSSWMIGVRDKISHVLTERAWVRGVGIDFLLQSCCCWCYVIQPVHHVLHECVVGCPIPSSTYEHVPINHRGVGIDFLLQSCCC